MSAGIVDFLLPFASTLPGQVHWALYTASVTCPWPQSGHPS